MIAKNQDLLRSRVKTPQAVGVPRTVPVAAAREMPAMTVPHKAVKVIARSDILHIFRRI